MTPDFLERRLRAIGKGGRFAITTDFFSDVFPPGHLDQRAYGEAAQFAAAAGCTIDYWKATNEVIFTK